MENWGGLSKSKAWSHYLMVVAIVGRGKLLPRRKPVKLFFNYSKVKCRALKKEN